MFQRFLSFLGFNTIASLQERSASTMSVFDKTKNDLISINKEIDLMSDAKLKEMRSLEQDIINLSANAVSNQKVVDKITKFFD
jgi:hypothetical protein